MARHTVLFGLGILGSFLPNSRALTQSMPHKMHIDRDGSSELGCCEVLPACPSTEDSDVRQFWNTAGPSVFPTQRRFVCWPCWRVRGRFLRLDSRISHAKRIGLALFKVHIFPITPIKRASIFPEPWNDVCATGLSTEPPRLPSAEISRLFRRRYIATRVPYTAFLSSDGDNGFQGSDS